MPMTKSIVSSPEAVPPLPVFCSSPLSSFHRTGIQPFPCSSGSYFPRARLRLGECRLYSGLEARRRGRSRTDRKTYFSESMLLSDRKRLVKQRAALENIRTVLQAAGSGLEHIVKVTIYLPNLSRDFGAMNEIYIQVGEVRNLTSVPC